MITKPLLDNVLNRVGGALIEAFFPTRCLVCRSFFHGDRQCINLKTLLRRFKGLDQDTWVPAILIHKNFGLVERANNHQGNFQKIFMTLMAPFLCTTCSATFLPVESPICSKCGIVFKSRQGEDRVCGDCIEAPKKYGVARSAGVYDQALMSAIHCLKYKGKIQLARPLGTLLFNAFSRYWDKKRIDIIVPVPLHERKLRIRGFNPPLLLVRNWPRIFEMLNGHLPAIPVDRDILARKKWTAPQTGLGRKERLQNIKNAFVMNDTSQIEGKKILLVDDVFTTGATVNECAKVLLKGGSKQVDVLTLARAM
ncbi:MAG: ComF family protein [Deltaproteobacteria bacterium]|jgi:ComF family protein|nr:ComF family protein [Deltaproteobacteria bacterium]MBW2671399.1 ComF family protein [Deltaproteobacteria bacterium]